MAKRFFKGDIPVVLVLRTEIDLSVRFTTLLLTHITEDMGFVASGVNRPRNLHLLL